MRQVVEGTYVDFGIWHLVLVWVYADCFLELLIVCRWKAFQRIAVAYAGCNTSEMD